MLGARREWGSLVVSSAAAAFSALARGERESPHDRAWQGELSPAPLLRSLSWSPEWALKAPPRDPATSRADPAFALALRRPPPPAAGASARGAAVRSRLPTCPPLAHGACPMVTPGTIFITYPSTNHRPETSSQSSSERIVRNGPGRGGKTGGRRPRTYLPPLPAARGRATVKSASLFPLVKHVLGTWHVPGAVLTLLG